MIKLIYHDKSYHDNYRLTLAEVELSLAQLCPTLFLLSTHTCGCSLGQIFISQSKKISAAPNVLFWNFGVHFSNCFVNRTQAYFLRDKDDAGELFCDALWKQNNSAWSKAKAFRLIQLLWLDQSVTLNLALTTTQSPTHTIFTPRRGCPLVVNICACND